jgi:hypothetical protein
VIICTPVYIERDGEEFEYDVEWSITGRYTKDTFEEPGECPEFEVVEIRDAEAKVVAPADYEKLGLTKKILDEAQGRASELAGDYEAGAREDAAEARAERDRD